MTGKESIYIEKVYANAMLAGDGEFTKRCHKWLEKNTGTNKALLTHSCTAALEMAAILLDIKHGDEIIMPSYTFVSTANAFVLRGGVPVFVDIREDTLNLNEALIEENITSRTKAIVPVHYAGVPCEMDSIISIANKHGLKVVEDAAQGVLSTYKGNLLGSIGDIGTYSFHQTKNLISGEGGALLINDDEFILRAEIIREKGTNRSSFARGEVDKYMWQDIGSSYLPSELIAAFLLAQFEEAEILINKRLMLWQRYHELLELAESTGLLRRPIIPELCEHNAHMYYILLPKDIDRAKVLKRLEFKGVSCVSHYEPLHSSPAGKKHGRYNDEPDITKEYSKCIIRLPLWIGMSKQEQDKVVHDLIETIKQFS